MQETLVRFLGQEDPLEKDRLFTLVFLGFPCGSTGKDSTCNVGDLDLIPGLRRSPGEGKGCPLQYSSMGPQRVGHDGVTLNMSFLHILDINPLSNI